MLLLLHDDDAGSSKSKAHKGQEDSMKTLGNCKWLLDADAQYGFDPDDFNRLVEICERHNVSVYSRDMLQDDLIGLPDSPHYYEGQHIYVRIEYLRQQGRLNK